MTENITDLVKKMTLQEKATLITGATPWQTAPVKSINLEPMTVADGPHGVRLSEDVASMITPSHPATCFPVAAALASSWNTELLEEMGQALADEAIALGVDVLLGPGMNIKRSPLCGRNFEYFSEDPYLSGKMASALIKGIQSKGVGTSAKHFVVNNQETRRFTVDAIVDERTLHEIYLAGFEIAVKEANPWTLMCAYNSVNGEFCAENEYLLTEVLRNQWGYEGFVMSDWGAVHDRVEAVKAGLELEMPGPSPDRTQAVIDAVEAGELDEAILDQAVARLLNIILKAQKTQKGGSQFNIDGHHKFARQIAGECIILLKNKGGILPLKGDEHLAVIGTAAQTAIYQGGGSSHINSTKVDNALDLLKERVEVQYVAGDASIEVDQTAIREAVTVAQSSDVAVLFIALPAAVESEGYDRANLMLTPQQVALIKAVASANPRTVVVLNNGSAIDMRAWIDDVEAVVESWLPGQAGAGAVMDVLLGDINPSGKLAETFPLRLEDTTCHLNFPGQRNEVRYGEGIYVGYRGYEALSTDVLFPFGFGLSYTQFEYSNLKISKSEFTVADTVEVSIDVKNVGHVAGKEIVQLYVHDLKSRLQRPVKELKAFGKVALQPGETKTITLTLNERSFSYYDPNYGQWLAEVGEFDILVGASSADIRLVQRVTLTEGTKVPSSLDLASTISDWMGEPKAAEMMKPMLNVFSEEANAGPELGVDMLTFFQDLPLTQLLSFFAERNEKSPQEIVQEMIDKLNASE